MGDKETPLIRVLIVDDEQADRAVYRRVLSGLEMTGEGAALRELRAKLRRATSGEAPSGTTGSHVRAFELTVCSGGDVAVSVVRQGVAAGHPFSIAFIDMLMPAGLDGVTTAEQIRSLDREIEIVLCTGHAELDPAEISRRVPPADKLSYLAKPFRTHELRQLALALGRRWHAERSLITLAYYDGLTGLPNREFFRTRLAEAIEKTRAASRRLGVLCVDLDNFKRINDTLGHSAGDEVLRLMAERLRAAVHSTAAAAAPPASPASADARPGDAEDIARLGGDEFMILLPDLRSAESAHEAAERLIESLRQPIQLGGHEVVITPSIGIALFPEHGQDVENLSRSADVAMYFAKQRRPGSYAEFDATMTSGALKRLTIESRLRDALARNEFSLNFQPQFDLTTGLVSGLEALLRWTSPELGPIPPNEFIPIAEQTGLILPIGEWVLRAACAAAKLWRDAGLPETRIAVNVSSLQFTQPDMPAMVAAVLRDIGLEPNLLELELTESLIMKDENWTKAAITALKALGVTIAIDDFGTGYSSFSRLRDFPVDRLKIDSSFVQHMVTRPPDHAVATAIISMAKSLGLGVIAEGVEEFQQLLALQELQCDHAQGYLLSRPLTAAAAQAFLQRSAASAATDNSRTQRLRRITM